MGFEQRGFARAVRPYQSDTIPAVDDPGQVIENLVSGEVDGDVVDIDNVHDDSLFIRRATPANNKKTTAASTHAVV